MHYQSSHWHMTPALVCSLFIIHYSRSKSKSAAAAASINKLQPQCTVSSILTKLFQQQAVILASTRHQPGIRQTELCSLCPLSTPLCRLSHPTPPHQNQPCCTCQPDPKPSKQKPPSPCVPCRAVLCCACSCVCLLSGDVGFMEAVHLRRILPHCNRQQLETIEDETR